jgi:tripartite motif-containing protein 71
VNTEIPMRIDADYSNSRPMLGRWNSFLLLLALIIFHSAASASAQAAELIDEGAKHDPGQRFGEYRVTLADLAQPTRAAISKAGEVFVVEKWAHRISVYSKAGELRRSFGSLGSGASELRDPSGVVLLEGSSSTRVFVADSGNHRIVCFDSEGNSLVQFGFFGRGEGELIRPSDVAIIGERLFVSDTGNHRVASFTFSGQPRGSLGSFGAGEGQLRQPMGLAVNNDQLLVADAGNHRIVTFHADGSFLRMFGDRGPYPGLFSLPTDIDSHGDRIYVADRGNHRVQVFSLDGTYLYEWGIHVLRPRDGEGHLHYPGGIAIAPDGEFAVVCEGYSDRVQFFGPARGPAEQYMTDPSIFAQGPARHYGMEIDAAGDTLLIAEPETESVVIFAIADTTPLMVSRLGGFGPLADDLARVSDVALSRDGLQIVATDASAHRISRYTMSRSAGAELRFDPVLAKYIGGASLDRLPLTIDGVKQPGLKPIEPGAVVRDEQSRIFVVDLLSSRVLRFSPRFELEAVFGGEGDQPGQLRLPTDLSLSPDGEELWVVDSGNRRLSVFDTSGKFLRNVAAQGELSRPHGVVVSADGTVFVTDAGAHRVLAFDKTGQTIRSWGRQGLGASEFFKPRGIAIDGKGHVIVLDHGNHRGQVFTLEGEFLSAFGARLYVKATRQKVNPK